MRPGSFYSGYLVRGPENSSLELSKKIERKLWKIKHLVEPGKAHETLKKKH